MLVIYKKYFFIRARSISALKKRFKVNEVIILEETDPLSAIITHHKKKLADYVHIETKEGISKYLTKKKGYANLTNKDKRILLGKTLTLGQFTWSKNEKKLPAILLILFIVLLEIAFVCFLSFLPGLLEKDFDLLIILLEIVGTTLTFFFSMSIFEPESHFLALKYDREAVEETRHVNKMLSLFGLALFVIGFYLQLNNLIN